MLLFPRSLPVGVKTESTACEGFVQPGGGSFLAAAHADTGERQTRQLCLDLPGIVAGGRT